MSSIDQLYTCLRPLVTGLGLELWGIEYFPGTPGLLRVYIESPTGVSVEDCEKVSRQASALLDVEDIVPEAYVLEVSSPGMDRILFDASQFSAYVGQKLQLQFLTLTEGRRKCNALLKSVSETGIEVEHEGLIFSVPFETIGKARVIPSF